MLCRCVGLFSAVSDSLRPHGLQSSRLLCPWDSPGKNTRVGCHVLLPTQGSNMGLLHYRQILHPLCKQQPANGKIKFYVLKFLELCFFFFFKIFVESTNAEYAEMESSLCCDKYKSYHSMPSSFSYSHKYLSYFPRVLPDFNF